MGYNAHSVSDQTAGTWNGIVGKMELRKQPAIWIKNVRITPEISLKQVTVAVEIESLQSSEQDTWEIEADAKGYNGNEHNPDPVDIPAILTPFSGDVDPPQG